MSRQKRLRVATALSLVALSSVVSCSDPDPDDGPDTGSEHELTTPGSTLEVGETATVTRDGAGEVLEVRITEVDQGSSADLAGVKRSTPLGDVPYFVHYELTHVSGPSPYLPVRDFLTGWAGDTQLALSDILEPFAPCEERTFRANAPVGSTVIGCATFVADEGAPPLDRVQLSYGDDYASSDGHEISWETGSPG